jgi:N-acetylmuramoyl-L-alanine amidase
MKSIFISAGHGGKDHGAHANGLDEDKPVMWLRDQVVLGLLRRGNAVTADGFGSINQPLIEVLELMKEADLKIEFHLNASDNPTANGTECLSLPRLKEPSQKIAQTISRVLGERLRGDYGWVDQSASPHGKLAFVGAGGIIVEVFFITNKKSVDTALYKKHDLAYALVETIHRLANS